MRLSICACVSATRACGSDQTRGPQKYLLLDACEAHGALAMSVYTHVPIGYNLPRSCWH